MAMSPEQKAKVLARAKILKDGGPAALAMLGMLDAFESKLNGIKGEQGPPGEVGEMGPMGLIGPEGPRGPMGPQGFDGKDGERGPQGERGPAGPVGPRGPQGDRGERGYQGRDGVLPTGDELMRMILGFSGAWLPASAIKDLPTVTRELPTLSIFGGNQGGGGARLEVLAGGVSLGQDVRKIYFSGATGVRNADGVVTITVTGGGSGDVTGPASSTDNAIARFDGTTGKIIQNSGASIDDSGNITGNNLSGTNTGDQTITLTGDVTGSGTGSFAATIANDAVTFAKFQNITDNRLLGRSAGSSGDMMEITIGTGLSLSGGVLSATGGSSGHTIQDEGTPLTARTNLNFVGADVTATDDAGNNATKVTISRSFARLFTFMGA